MSRLWVLFVVACVVWGLGHAVWTDALSVCMECWSLRSVQPALLDPPQ